MVRAHYLITISNSSYSFSPGQSRELDGNIALLIAL
jgi:hypothetical protein